MDQLLQSMNNLILAIGNNVPNQPQESKFLDGLRTELKELVEIEYPTTIQQALKKAKAMKVKIGKLKKAISDMAQSIKTLIQRQQESNKLVASTAPNQPPHMITENNRPNNNTNSNNRVTQNKDNKNQIYLALIAKELTRAIGTTI
ncbi:4694_t:CDS:2, partial [Gigaspora margarita]